jgi:transposase-like protein
MHLGLLEAWEGRKRTSPSCPLCKSPRSRPSRRRYEGAPARLFKVRPVKCLACGSYFPVALTGAIPGDAEFAELNIPFRPTEIDPFLQRDSVEILPQASRSVFQRLTVRGCPTCGSKETRPTRSEMAVPWFRLDARETYRCTECNGSFVRTNVVRFAALSLLLASVLGVAAFFINAINVKPSSDTSPRIRRNAVPPVPPPVFRKP